MILILKIFLLVLFLALLVLAILNILGGFFPKKIKYSIINSYFHSEDKILQTLGDIIHYPEWKENIDTVNILNQYPMMEWTEKTNKNITINYEADPDFTSNAIVFHTSGPHLPLHMIRKYTVWRKDYMSFIRIEEELTIHKWHLRSLGRIFFDPKQELRITLQYLDNYLDKKYGEN